jgi:hypothetical protein
MNGVRHITVLLAIGLAACASSALRAADRARPPAWELWPYRVHVVVAVERGGGMPPSLEDKLMPWLKAKAEAAVGGMWKLEVLPAPVALRQKLLTEFDSLPAENIHGDPKSVDKLIFTAVRRTEWGWQVRAREYDVVTGLWNSTISRDVRQADLIRHETFQAIMAAFAPLARIEQADGDNVTLRLRASALAPGGRVLLSGGTAFRPVLLESDASGAITGKATLVDWTYLTSAESSGTLIKCRMQTALSGAVIPAYHPQRQRWAIAVAPSSAATRLRLVTRGGDAAPIEGCQVVALELSTAGGVPKEVVIGHSDRRGEVEIPAVAQAVRLIEVRHGGEVLARVPIAVGLGSAVTLPLQFDPKRLALESAISQLADDLVDLTARREVLSARIRAAEQGGKADDASALRQQLREIGGADPLLSRLDKLQQQVQAASPATQKHMQERLTSLRKGIDQLKAPQAAAK